MTASDGGPAFPTSKLDGCGDLFVFAGMTLRDYFSAKVMSGLCIDYPDSPNMDDWDFDELARHAYRAADAMIAQRSK